MDRQKTVTFARKPFFRNDPTTTILATIGLFLLSQIIAIILLSTYPLLMNWTESQATTWITDSPAAQFFYVLFAEVVAIAMVFRLLAWARVTKARIGLVMPKLKDVGVAVLAYAGYFVLFFIIANIARVVIPGLDLEQEQKIGFETVYSNLDILMAFVTLVILPPIAEEIIFRGFLFTSLRAKYRLRYAIIITSVLFGIAHLQFGSGAPLLWIAAIDTFLLSCFLCYIRDKTGSLWAPIYLHAIKNAVAFSILFGSHLAL